MVHDLLKPPETACPMCGGNRLGWGGGALSSPARLAVARLLSWFTPLLLPLRLGCRDCKAVFEHLHVLPRTVVGYHGCRRDFADGLVAGRVNMEAWKTSQNDYDWLGEGVYFWEHAPGRAWQWAREQYGDEGAVVAAAVRLGRCLDLADTAFTGLLQQSFDGTVDLYARQGWPLPKNGGREFKLRKLDRLVIDRLTRATDRADGVHYQTVRCPFEEGDPVYDGGMIKAQSHVQIAVRDKRCIASRIYRVGREGG